ncbi:MAG: hypothetical protein Q8J89_01650 [Caulobacter sp.]|nr:hypothetical protein [Caulobacter sp.]
MRSLALAAFALLLAAPAAAQVEVAPLAAPDYFSLGSRDTGLPGDLWRDSSGPTAAAIIPVLGARPLTPAARDLAWRLLATAAVGPEGAGRDPAVAGARIQSLLALGRPAEAWAAAERAGNLSTHPALAEAVAETALIVGDDDRACRIANDLSIGRGEIYWLRLRAYCEARAGETGTAQLTLTLANERQRDPVVARLVGAVIAGAGDPGAASVRSGLEYSLSRRLALDIAAAKGASPGVAAMIAGPLPSQTLPDPGLAGRFVRPEGRAAEFDALIWRTQAADSRARARHEAAVLLAIALGATPTAEQRAAIAGFTAPQGAAASGRLAALDLAAAAGLKGETALLALAIVADAEGKPRPADYAPMVSALRRVGLADAAVAFADEAFAALQIE